MRAILAIAKKEILSYFLAPMAYIIISAFLLMNGFLFYLILAALSQPNAGSAAPMGVFFGGTLLFWLYLIITVPVITMRLGAEERKSGTIETLMTAPVSDWEVVLGKYSAAMTLYAAMWAPTLLYAFVLTRFGEVDWGPVATGYVGVLLVGTFFVAVGLFTSLLSKNQLVAAIIAFAILTMLLSVSILSFIVTEGFLKSVVEYVDLWGRLQDFSKGILDSRPIIYFLSGAAIFLVLSRQVLETRRWR